MCLCPNTCCSVLTSFADCGRRGQKDPALFSLVCVFEGRFTGHTDITVIGAGWCSSRSICTFRLLQWWHWKKVMKHQCCWTYKKNKTKTNERQHECKTEWEQKKRRARRWSLWCELGFTFTLVRIWKFHSCSKVKASLSRTHCTQNSDHKIDRLHRSR